MPGPLQMIQRALVPSPFFLTEVPGILSGSQTHVGEEPRTGRRYLPWEPLFTRMARPWGGSSDSLCPLPCVLVPPTAGAAGLGVHAPALALAIVKATQRFQESALGLTAAAVFVSLMCFPKATVLLCLPSPLWSAGDP